ncbi:malonyl-CoA decarboxylase [Enemella sp. A6]|uniref:malonyl-CoA decarboxylase n=1 Tax=Enemella sp. A6 TaxID=3440152 RepID=UPI003EB8274A
MARRSRPFLTDLIRALTGERRSRERDPDSPEALEHALARPPLERLLAACDVLMGQLGEASLVAVAAEAVDAYAELDEEGKAAFFRHLRDHFGAEATPIRAAYADWSENPDAANLAVLFRSAEPRRQQLLRRLNMTSGATLDLVHMRADLLRAAKRDPELVPLDADFVHLLTAWFNRGFLEMRRIDWETSASILEKILEYESVHPMDGWDELRRRLDPVDRRCYAFFHPTTGNEPLIFVEVALTREIPGAIAPLLEPGEAIDPEDADTAVFYSINNSLTGLRGISFGSFLLKQVVAALGQDLPGLQRFVTLSPAPGFARWLASEAEHDAAVAELVDRLDERTWLQDQNLQESLRPAVLGAAARYFLRAKNPKGAPLDPVARFHLGNGASADRITWPADLSESALSRGYGVMINYRYELGLIEARHEAFVRDNTVTHSDALEELLDAEQE